MPSRFVDKNLLPRSSLARIVVAPMKQRRNVARRALLSMDDGRKVPLKSRPRVRQ
jgi:hypothetical protein